MSEKTAEERLEEIKQHINRSPIGYFYTVAEGYKVARGRGRDEADIGRWLRRLFELAEPTDDEEE